MMFVDADSMRKPTKCFMKGQRRLEVSWNSGSLCPRVGILFHPYVACIIWACLQNSQFLIWLAAGVTFVAQWAGPTRC